MMGDYDDDSLYLKPEPPVHPTCRKVYWFGCGFGWVVWVLTTAAAGDENWGELPAGDGYGVATGFACDEGDANDSFCTAHRNFAAAQKAAAVMCSVAVLLFTVSFFRPSQARYGSSKGLGLVGGVFMALFTFCQMVSILFLVKSIQEYNRYGGDASMAKTGDTYGLGITAFVFGLIQVIIVLGFFGQAANGPLLSCTRRISEADDMGAGSATPTPRGRR
ncbi:unnamed protein product [Ectocarpus sp. 6 AP-2014]